MSSSRQTPPRDHRDLALPTEAQLVEALINVDAYRLLAQQALHALHELRRELERTRQAHARTLDEYRTLRERVMREAGGNAA